MPPVPSRRQQQERQLLLQRVVEAAFWEVSLLLVVCGPVRPVGKLMQLSASKLLGSRTTGGCAASICQQHSMLPWNTYRNVQSCCKQTRQLN
jgi:hypothetical protein